MITPQELRQLGYSTDGLGVTQALIDRVISLEDFYTIMSHLNYNAAITTILSHEILRRNK
jgi:hypothetical protein